MLTFAFMHYPYLVCILFGMPSLHLFTFLMFFKSCDVIVFGYSGLIERGRTRDSEQKKRAKVAANLLYVSSYRG